VNGGRGKYKKSTTAATSATATATTTTTTTTTTTITTAAATTMGNGTHTWKQIRKEHPVAMESQLGELWTLLLKVNKRDHTDAKISKVRLTLPERSPKICFPIKSNAQSKVTASTDEFEIQ
jgi:hypothetical protein